MHNIIIDYIVHSHLRRARLACLWDLLTDGAQRIHASCTVEQAKQCNQGFRRHGSLVSVQLMRMMHKAVLLIIRRSWVRAPPAPSSGLPAKAPLTCHNATVRGALRARWLCGCVRRGASVCGWLWRIRGQVSSGRRLPRRWGRRSPARGRCPGRRRRRSVPRLSAAWRVRLAPRGLRSITLCGMHVRVMSAMRRMEPGSQRS